MMTNKDIENLQELELRAIYLATEIGSGRSNKHHELDLLVSDLNNETHKLLYKIVK